MSTLMKSEMKSVKFSTDYGNVIASDYINPRWSDYDKLTAETHLDNYGVILIDADSKQPIDDEFLLEEIYEAYCQIK